MIVEIDKNKSGKKGPDAYKGITKITENNKLKFNILLFLFFWKSG